MIKKSYEFADLSSIREREAELEEREIKAGKMVFKICSKCGERKSILRFSVDKRNSDGRIRICKACRSRESLAYYYQNQDKMLIQGKEYRDNHKKNRSIYNKRYREDHKEHLKKEAKKYYRKNRKKIKKRNLKYYEENKEDCLVRRELWRIKNRERIKKYNRGYKLKRKIAS